MISKKLKEESVYEGTPQTLMRYPLSVTMHTSGGFGIDYIDKLAVSSTKSTSDKHHLILIVAAYSENIHYSCEGLMVL